MKKTLIVLIIIIAIGTILSCKLFDRVVEDKANVIITFDYSQISAEYRLNKLKSDAFDVKSIDEVKLVIYDIDYSYSTVNNNYSGMNIQSDWPETNFEKYWVNGVENELDDISSDNCQAERSEDLTISNNKASGEFELEAGVKYFLAGLFENGNLKYRGLSNIVELNPGDSKKVSMPIRRVAGYNLKPYNPSGRLGSSVCIDQEYKQQDSYEQLYHQ